MYDSHAHVTDQAFDTDREQVLARAHAAGVIGWVEIGTDLATSRQAIAVAQQLKSVYATVGVHPNDVHLLTDENWQEIERLLTQDKVVAVGEVGLDYSRTPLVELQKNALLRFIALAQPYHLPIVLHVRSGNDRDAHQDLLDLFTSLQLDERPRGVIHTFSGTREQAQQYLDLGLYLSISGVVTFKNAGAMLDVAKTIPLDRLLIETDCPYLTPEPHRGQRNEPAYVRYVAQKIAAVRGVSVDEIGQITEKNTRELFGLG